MSRILEGIIITIGGTHGTTSDASCSITKEGFNPKKMGKDGRIGVGVYLWSDHLDWQFELAKAWVFQRHRQKKGVVIDCQVNIEENQIVDVESEDMKLTVSRLLDTHYHLTSCEIHDLVIKEYEKRSKINVIVVKGRVFAPRKECFLGKRVYRSEVLGSPTVFAIKTSEAINILNFCEFNDE